MPEVTVSKDTADSLEAFATAEQGILEQLLKMQMHNLEESELDPRAYSLVKIAALIAIDAPPASFMAQVTIALEAGVTPEEILGVLIAVAPQVGIPKVVAAAPEVMLALGLALEED
jgi:alkylhydroperoxidase/carboxymuconolactone decarboxylase family protein YurZ